MTVLARLTEHVNAGTIIFDAGAEDRLKGELYRNPPALPITERLQATILEIADIMRGAGGIRISSLVRSNDDGRHGENRAVDIGNEGIASTLLPTITTAAKIAELEIDEIIFDASIAGQGDSNHWNLKNGVPFNYSNGVLGDHRNHIHISVQT